MTIKAAHLLTQSLPWLTGSSVALGQGLLATGCSIPKVGQCLGCGSCVIAVATLTGLALKNRHAQKTQEREPFERDTRTHEK